MADDFEFEKRMAEKRAKKTKQTFGEGVYGSTPYISRVTDYEQARRDAEKEWLRQQQTRQQEQQTRQQEQQTRQQEQQNAATAGLSQNVASYYQDILNERKAAEPTPSSSRPDTLPELQRAVEAGEMHPTEALSRYLGTLNNGSAQGIQENHALTPALQAEFVRRNSGQTTGTNFAPNVNLQYQMAQMANRGRAEGTNEEEVAGWVNSKSAPYQGIRNNKDYLANTKADEKYAIKGLYTATGKKAKYNYITNLNGFADSAKKSRENELSKYDFMTENERKDYTYIANTQGLDAAEGYLDYLDYDLNARASEAAQAAWAKNAQGTGNAIGASATSVLANSVSGLGTLNLLGQNINKALTGKPVDYNAPALNASKYTQTVRGQVAKDIEKAHPNATVAGVNLGSFLYQTGMSMADSAVVALLGSLGVPQPGIILGSSAAVNATLNAKERGLTDAQALTTGLASGIAEMLFEEISLEKIIHPTTAKSVGGVVKNILLQAFTEGSEEVATTLANTLTDALINGDKSEILTRQRELQADGMSEEEARRAAWNEWGTGLLTDLLGGAISGGQMGTGANVSNYMSEANYRMTGDAYKQMGMTNDELRDALVNVKQNTYDPYTEEWLGKLTDRAARGEDLMQKLPSAEIGKVMALQAGLTNTVLTQTEYNRIARLNESPYNNVMDEAPQTAQEAQEATRAEEAPLPARAENAAETQARTLTLPTVEEAPTQNTQQTLTMPTAEERQAQVAEQQAPAQQAQAEEARVEPNAPATLSLPTVEAQQEPNAPATLTLPTVAERQEQNAPQALTLPTVNSRTAETEEQLIDRLKKSEAGLAQDDYTATMDQRTVKLLDTLAKKLGLRVAFADEVNRGKANADITGNVVLIEKGNPNPVRFLIGHEATHWMKRNADGGYNAFEKAARKADAVWFQNREAEIRQAYEKQGISIDEAGIREEAVSDYAGLLADNSDTLERFITENKDDRSALEKVRDFFRHVKEFLTGDERAKVERAERRLIQALQQTERNVASGEGARQGNNTQRSIKSNIDGTQAASYNNELTGGVQNGRAQEGTAGAELDGTSGEGVSERRVRAARGDRAEGRALRQGDIPVSGIVQLSESSKQLLNDRSVGTVEMEYSTDHAAFSALLDEARTIDEENGWAVTPKTVEALENCRTFLSADGGVGFALAPNGDIEAVFRNRNRHPQGRAMRSVIPQAIANGGTKLDCYGPRLARVYADAAGMVPVCRVSFDPEFANPGWTPDKGQPDVVFMMATDTDADTIIQKQGTYHIPTDEEIAALPLFTGETGYDDAAAYRDRLLEERLKAGNTEEETKWSLKESDSAYLSAVNSGDMATAQRMVDEAAKKAGFVDAIPEQTSTYAVRTGRPPKNTVKVYKVFTVTDDGSPTALFVSGTEKLPQNVWLNAQDTWHFTAKNGLQYVPSTQNPYTEGGKTGGQVEIPNDEIRQELIRRGFLPKGSKAKAITALAYRPGWHAGDLPFFPQGGMQIEGSNYKNVHRYNQVVFECEMDADTDYTTYHTNKDGKTVFHDMETMPDGGFYKFSTNPMANAQDIGSWYISGSLKIGRALTEAECNKILQDSGRPIQEWQQYQDKDARRNMSKEERNAYEHTMGPMNLAALGYTGERFDAARKTLAPVTYDDDGKVIPLSERFNPENDDIRYSLKGLDADAIPESVRRYGRIQPGEKPTRDVQVPKKVTEDKNERVSQTIRTVLEAGATPDAAVPTISELVEKGAYSYQVYSDKDAIAKAEDTIKDKGWEATLTAWVKDVSDGTVNKTNTALGWALYNNAANEGDLDTALNVLDLIVRHQRNAAQAVQATRILKQLTPEAQLYGVQRSVDNLIAEIKQKYGKDVDIQVNRDLARAFLNAKTEEERRKALEALYKDVGRQLPSRFVDKWNAWRYLAMLGNPRTHVRNIVGNAGFAPVVLVKDQVGTMLESIAYRLSGGKTDRTKGLVLPGWDHKLVKAAWDRYDEIMDEALGGGKYTDMKAANDAIEQSRVIFKFKPLEVVRRFNRDALDKEDIWFNKPHYVYAMAQYCKANDITPAQIASGKGLEKAEAYAIKEAQKATYRDINAFSNFVSSIGRSTDRKTPVGKVASAVIEGILPFRRTPANILARGVEYSPLGLAKSLTYDIYQVMKKDADGNPRMTVSEMLDNVSAGLTGTGLLALGMLLSKLGLLRGHGEDDEKARNFDDLTGHQNYALQLPNGDSYTLDWLAPEALPVFVGVNLYERMLKTKGEMKMNDLLKAISSISEPMLEMSMIQGINDLLETVSFAKNNETSALFGVLSEATISYLTQAFPTLLGQSERTGENIRMTTYTDKNKWLMPDLQYSLGKVSAKTPGWDYDQIPYIDAWGRTEVTGDGWLERAFKNMINPGYTDRVRMSDMEKELLRLYNVNPEDNGGVLPTRAGRKIGDTDLTGEQYVKYATKKGELSYELAERIIKSAAYKKATDAERVEMIKDAYDYANEKGRAAAIPGYKPSKNKAWMAEMDETVKETKVSRADYISARYAASQIKGIPDGEGGTVTNSAGLKKMDYLYGLTDLTQKQREAMMADFGVSESLLESAQSKDDVNGMLEFLDAGIPATEYKDYKIASGVRGIDLDTYKKGYNAYYDADGSGTKTNADWTAVLDKQTFSKDTAQNNYIKGVLWQLYTNSTSTKNNPYDKSGGQYVLDERDKAKAGGSGSGSYARANIPTLKLPTVEPVQKRSTGRLELPTV